jgi:hypothetical protein
LVGRHRWIVTAAFVVKDIDAALATDPDHSTLLDHENMFHLALGCWDCEKALGEIDFGSICIAPGVDP